MRKMPNNDSGVWKWLATTLGGAVLGAVVVMVVSSAPLQALTSQQRAHEQLEAHPVAAAMLDAFEEDMDELKNMIRALGVKIDRFHEQ